MVKRKAQRLPKKPERQPAPKPVATELDDTQLREISGGANYAIDDVT